jgi:hypothetical protein
MAITYARESSRWKTLILCLSLVLLVPVNSPAQELRQSQEAPGEAAGKTSNQGPRKRGAQTGSPTLAKAEETEEEYRNRITDYFYKQNYEQLEKEAQEARTTKERFPGGIWKLFVFYEALDAVDRSNQATEDDWMGYQYLAQEWVKWRPSSITAQVARAEAYMNYAWHARGTGYADTVTDEGWKLFNSRVESARFVLNLAGRLNEKCPYWYEAMQHVATAQGWSKPEARNLFEQAIAFEPSYYHYYREYTGFLLPKWHGEDGEAEAFAAETVKRVPGPQGLFLYFEISSVIVCPCGGENASEHLQQLSWPTIKQGYESLTQLYGSSRLKRNRYAFMAITADDVPTAQRMFAEIGENWEPQVWWNKANFETARKSLAKRAAPPTNQPTSASGVSP